MMEVWTLQPTLGRGMSPSTKSAAADDGSGILGCLGTLLFVGALLISIILLYSRSSRRAEQRRREARAQHLIARFGPEIAARILRSEMWQGMTTEMLVESMGPPVDRDEVVMKTKVKRTFKYRHQGANRFGLRIFLEGDEVVGWEDKR